MAVKSYGSDSAVNRERGALSALGTTGAPVPTTGWAGYHNDIPATGTGIFLGIRAS